MNVDFKLIIISTFRVLTNRLGYKCTQYQVSGCVLDVSFFSFFFLVLPDILINDLLPLRSVGRKLLGLIALALDLDEGFFEQVGALNDPTAVVRLLRYPGMYQ